MTPVDDSLWSIEFAGADRIAGWDSELAREITQHFAAFAQTRIAPLDAPGDLQGCRLADGRVHLPDGFGAAYRAMAEDGWQGLSVPEEFGGQGLNAAVQALVSEVFSGSCHALQMVSGLVPGAVRLLLRNASPDQQARFIPRLATGEWLATMCLTEADAGSDLSRIRTRARSGAGGWQVTGEKIFISGGDQDASDNILHLVLARTGPERTRGLSLFACPAVLDDGTRNAITVARLEQKMGLHASPTCQMVFDGARGELIGAPGQGLAAMFMMMNHARLDVALQGVAHAARAHAIARDYAAVRMQGRGEDGEAASIDQHPDVSRMLDEMDARTLAARSIAHSALVALETGNMELADFLTPVAKVAGSEAGTHVADLGIQVLGGYGYLHEYRLEQGYRDARICAIYEGANGIHALALATRGLNHEGGAQAKAFANWIEDIAAAHGADHLAPALDRWRNLSALAKASPQHTAHVLMQATIALLGLAFWQRVKDEAAGGDRMQRLADGALRRNARRMEDCLHLASGL